LLFLRTFFTLFLLFLLFLLCNLHRCRRLELVRNFGNDAAKISIDVLTKSRVRRRSMAEKER
jgi:hypothetical protein